MSAVPLSKLILFGVLSVADFLLTWGLIEGGGGQVYETNPIADWWLQSYGWSGLAFFKFLIVGVFTASAVLICLHRPRAGRHLVTFGCVAVAVVVIYSCVLTGFVHAAQPDPGKDLSKMVIVGYRR
jgi:hypothetical protein